MLVGVVARQAALHFLRRLARDDRDAIPAFLAMPQRVVAGRLDRGDRKFLLRRLEFLQAHDVGLALLEIVQEGVQPAVDTVDVVGGEQHGVFRIRDGSL